MWHGRYVNLIAAFYAWGEAKVKAKHVISQTLAKFTT